MKAEEQLVSFIRRANPRPDSPRVNTLVQEIISLNGDAVQAVLFYGSCLRKGDDERGIVDLYVLVDRYRHAYRKYSHAFFNQILPPNVFYLEVQYEGHKSRAKYAVFSLEDFRRGTSGQWFHSYLWGRLSQPVAIIYARNREVEAMIHAAQASAVTTFISRVLPVLSPQFTGRELWCQGLAHSYAAELRPERRDKLEALFDGNMLYYEKLTRAVLDLVPFSVETITDKEGVCYRARVSVLTRVAGRLAWFVRRIQGKGLSILRLLKGLLTFKGGVSYILWKIERHSGVTVEINSKLRKIPLVGMGVLLWRLYRRGAFR